MSSHVYLGEKPKGKEFSLTLEKRLLWVLVACCIQMVYIPASHRAAGGIEPKLPIDTFPIWPIWVLPYVLCYLLWFGSAAWIVFRVEDRQFRSVIAACILTFGLGVLTFTVFPTYVKPADLHGNDLFTLLLRHFHEQMGRYAAFPSGHVYITTLLVLFFKRWYPRFKILWFSVLIVVSLSTLFTGQHYILDVLGGYLAAHLGHYFGLWWVGFDQPQKYLSNRSKGLLPRL